MTSPVWSPVSGVDPLVSWSVESTCLVSPASLEGTSASEVVLAASESSDSVA